MIPGPGMLRNALVSRSPLAIFASNHRKSEPLLNSITPALRGRWCEAGWGHRHSAQKDRGRLAVVA